MIFGGLELLAGGYLVHRQYRKKREKERLDQYAQPWRHDTFPGADNTTTPYSHYQPQHQKPVRTLHNQSYSVLVETPQQTPEWTCHDPAANQHELRPQALVPTQSFKIPRRPVPEREPQIIIQPSLQRTDSLATLSRMPVANGLRSYILAEEAPPNLPSRKIVSGLLPTPQQRLYGNSDFSMSTPALGATPTFSPLTYEPATIPTSVHTYEAHPDRCENIDRTLEYTLSESTQLGEGGPPPPYAP